MLTGRCRPIRLGDDAAREGLRADAREHDRRLVVRMLAGEERAFAEFFDLQFPRLYRFALVRLGRDSDATEDVVQATLSRAVMKLSMYRGEAALSAWLRTICRHEISDHRARSGRYVSIDLFGDAPDVQAATDSVTAAGPGDPEMAVQREQTSQLVHAVLDALPEHYADALEWKYLQKLSVREIADRLGVGSKAAESVLSRARDAFREEFSSVSQARGVRGREVLSRRRSRLAGVISDRDPCGQRAQAPVCERPSHVRPACAPFRVSD